MFELEKELQSWCQAILRRSPRRSTRLVELEDHLYCEIERLQASGHSEEEAFRVATQRFGNVEEVASEYSKNQTRLGALCHRIELIERPMKNWVDSQSTRRVAGLQIAVALVFAGLILLCSYLLAGTGNEEIVRNLLIAVWFVPFSLLSTKGSRGSSCKKTKLG